MNKYFLKIVFVLWTVSVLTGCHNAGPVGMDSDSFSDSASEIVMLPLLADTGTEPNTDTGPPEDTETPGSDIPEDTEGCTEIEKELSECYHVHGCDPEICICEWKKYAIACDVNAHYFQGE